MTITDETSEIEEEGHHGLWRVFAMIDPHNMKKTPVRETPVKIHVTGMDVYTAAENAAEVLAGMSLKTDQDEYNIIECSLIGIVNVK